jgi:hypothetical protein
MTARASFFAKRSWPKPSPSWHGISLITPYFAAAPDLSVRIPVEIIHLGDTQLITA